MQLAVALGRQCERRQWRSDCGKHHVEQPLKAFTAEVVVVTINGHAGWTWTNTGSQSSTLNETVRETRQSMPDLATGTPVAFTNQTQLERTTSATELSNSATVLRTSTGSSTQGSSWGGTSTVGTFSNPGESGISMRAHALVPVGSDGLSYVMNNNPTNYVGDYAWLADDILVGSTTAPPEAQGYTRNFGSPLATQKTLAATPGASTTNSDNAASTGSGGTGSNGGTTSYGSGGSSSSPQGPALPPGHIESQAGLHFIRTTGMIMTNGDDAASKALTNAIASAQAPFIHCDGNSCVSVAYRDLTTGLQSSDPSAIVYGGSWVSVQTKGQPIGMAGNAQQNSVTLAIEPTLDEMLSALYQAWENKAKSEKALEWNRAALHAMGRYNFASSIPMIGNRQQQLRELVQQDSASLDMANAQIAALEDRLNLKGFSDRVASGEDFVKPRSVAENATRRIQNGDHVQHDVRFTLMADGSVRESYGPIPSEDAILTVTHGLPETYNPRAATPTEISLTINDELRRYEGGPDDWDRIQAGGAVAWTIAGLAPGVGEVQDVQTLNDRDASKVTKVLAVGSLLLSGLTLGVSPNLGRAAKGVDGVLSLSDEAADVMRCMEKASEASKKKLRQEACDIWQAKTGRRAIWDKMQIHHRIPLEWSHLFPDADPNRLANLAGMSEMNHGMVSDAWAAFKTGLNGRTPTQFEVLQRAIEIEEAFGDLMKLLP